MTRKLVLLAAILLMTAWASSVDAIGPCSCTYCNGFGAGQDCNFEGGITTCACYVEQFC